MKYKRVLFIQPPYKRSAFSPVPYFPIGLGYLAETLEQHGIDCDVLDMALGYKTNELLNKIAQFKPDLLGCSMISYKFKDAYALLEQVKRAFPLMKIIVGGPHVSSLREAVLKDCSHIDYGVVREGEKTLMELLEGHSLQGIKGLIYRKENGQIVFNGEREFIANLDEIPFPRYRKFELDKYKARFGSNPGTLEINITTSRGCPYQCIFCTVNAAIGRKFRTRSAKNVIDELTYWYSLGVRTFAFLDDNFTQIKKRVYEICDEIEKSGMKIKFSLGNGIRADRLDYDLLKRMKEVGCYRFSIGVEAGNDRVLSVLKKGENLETIEEAIKAGIQLGYDIRPTFLVGSPTETWQDIEDSMRLALKYPFASVGFFSPVPYYASELFQYIEQTPGCYFTKAPEVYLNRNLGNKPLFVTPELSYKDRKMALRKTRVISKKVTCRNIIRKNPKYAWLLTIFAPIYYSKLVQSTLPRFRLYQKMTVFLKSTLAGSAPIQ